MSKTKANAPAVATLAALAVAAMDPAKLEAHPLSALTPEMNGDQVEALAQDMKRNGQKTPVVLYEGKVLDGRARVKAAGKADIKVNVVHLPTGTAPRAFVYSMNVHRRQLTGVQLARVAVGYMQENKSQKLTQDEVADLFGLGAKTLRYVARAVESGNEGLIKLIENPDTTRGELRMALVAAGIMPDVVAKDEIGGELLPEPFKGNTPAQAPADVTDILGPTTGGSAKGGSVQRAATAESTVGAGRAAAARAAHSPSGSSVTHVQQMANVVDVLARSTEQDLEAFYRAAVQRGVWSRLSKVHAKAVATQATAKAAVKGTPAKATAKA